MGIKISKKLISYILLTLIVISCLYILIFVSYPVTDRGSTPVPEGPMWGFWNQTSNKSFYLTYKDSVYVGYGKNYTNYSHSPGYWEKINYNTYVIRWPDSTNETLVYDTITQSYTGTTGIYNRVK